MHQRELAGQSREYTSNLSSIYGTRTHGRTHARTHARTDARKDAHKDGHMAARRAHLRVHALVGLEVAATHGAVAVL